MFEFLNHVYADTAQNLALEEALLLPSQKNPIKPCLRIWENPEVSVVLGRGEKTEQQVDEGKAQEAGLSIYRRISGGGTVLHGPGNLNISFFLPYDYAEGLKSIQKSYQVIHSWVCDALEPMTGLRPEIRGGSDLVLGDKKISGTAQARKRFGLLHHMTLLVDFDIEPYLACLRQPEKQPDYRENRKHWDFITTLKREGHNFKLKNFLENLEKVLGGFEQRILTEEDVQIVQQLTFNKYIKKHWNIEGSLKP